MIEGRASDLIADLFPSEVAVTASRIPGSIRLETACLEAVRPTCSDREARCGGTPSPAATNLRRLRELTAGRACARRVLAGFGVDDAHLLPDADGRPRWPGGYVGSISHAGGLCVVAVARREQIAGLGVDIEVAQRLDEESWDLVCSAAELEWLHRQRGRQDPGLLATALFSAKESSFKCAARAGERFEPRAFEIIWHADRFHCHVPARGTLFGRLRVRSGWVVSGCQLPVPPARDSSPQVDAGLA